MALQIWFATGSQGLYGPEALKIVEANSWDVVAALSSSSSIPAAVIFKGVLTTPREIEKFCITANSSKECVGVILWMHTFSPAQNWVGLDMLRKPILHLHTQYFAAIPDDIDMDYMNLHQSAHGDREFGYMCTRLGIRREVVAGFYGDTKVQAIIGDWVRVALAWDFLKHLGVLHLGENMRNVAVTEGDRVGTLMKLGFRVDGYGLGDLIHCFSQVNPHEINKLMQEWGDIYNLSLCQDEKSLEVLRDEALVELGLEMMMQEAGCGAFTTSFQDLHGLKRLPGLAVQHLMYKGYGFGAEGDWKTAALVAFFKQICSGAASFMEDYTYDLEKGIVLGAHMLEMCPSIADKTQKPVAKILPLSIGGKGDPVRLVFSAAAGSAINVCLVNFGDRLRMIANPVKLMPVPPEKYPNLPVPRALWQPAPDLETASSAWIYAGGSHHTALGVGLNKGQLKNFARMADIELVMIDEDTTEDMWEFEKSVRVR